MVWFLLTFLACILPSNLSWNDKMSLIIFWESCFRTFWLLLLIKFSFALEFFIFTNSVLSWDSSQTIEILLIGLVSIFGVLSARVISFTDNRTLWPISSTMTFGFRLSNFFLSSFSSLSFTRTFIIFLFFKLIRTLIVSVLAMSLIVYLYASVWPTGMPRGRTFTLLIETHRFSNTGFCIQFASIDLSLVLGEQTLISSFREIQRRLLDWFLSFSFLLSHLLYCLWSLGNVLVGHLNVFCWIISLVDGCMLCICVFPCCILQS